MSKIESFNEASVILIAGFSFVAELNIINCKDPQMRLVNKKTSNKQAIYMLEGM